MGEWCGIEWSPWVELSPGKSGSKGMPDAPGAFIFRSVDGTVDHIGTTSRGLQSYVRNVRQALMDPEPPSGDLSPWLKRMWGLEDKGFEMRFAADDRPSPDLKGLARFLVWQHRIETGSSPRCTHAVHVDPLTVQGGYLGRKWMGLDWSDPVVVSLAPASKGRGLVAFTSPTGIMLRISSGDIAPVVRRWRRSGIPEGSFYTASAVAASDESLRVLRDDVIGAHFLIHGHSPELQYR